MSPKPRSSTHAGVASDGTIEEAGKRVLVAEDNPVNQQLTLQMLSKLGCAADLVANGREAVDAVLKAVAAEEPYDLVFMDVQMPELDGLGAAAALRDAGLSPNDLTIIALTANVYRSDIDACIAAGMQGHVAKPVRQRQLAEALGMSGRTSDASSGKVDVETEPSLVAMFTKKIEITVKLVSQALESDLSTAQHEALVTALHQLSGTAMYFGGAELGDFAREAEAALTTESRTEIELALTKFLDSVEASDFRQAA